MPHDRGVSTLPSMGRERPRGWRRIFHVHADRMGQAIPSLDALEDEIDKRVAAGESEDDVALVVVEDFEKSAATVNARTIPLVPASGIVVTGVGILARTDGEGEAATIISLFAMAFALVGLGFLATALFTHAGRPRVGLAPARTDVAFVHDRLVKKDSNAQVGSLLTGVGFVVLLVVIL